MTALNVTASEDASLSTPIPLRLWETMLLIRKAEEAVAELVESGEARCPCHLYIGQEAIAAGVCAALRSDDTVWGGHRSHGHYLAKGGSLTALFAEILGKTTGCAKGRGGSMHLIAADSGIVGTVPIVAATVPLAAGAAFAAKLRGRDSVAVAFFGDGAIEEGHVHETMNLAGLHRLPLVLVCENNLYSSHMHWRERRREDNLHRAGEFHSIPGERLDGNDVLTVYESASRAIARARAGEGPTLLECRTFRWKGHVGSRSDLDVGVARREELGEWIRRDPIGAAARRLAAGGITDLSEREERIARMVAAALKDAREAALPEAGRVNRFVYQEATCAA